MSQKPGVSVDRIELGQVGILLLTFMNSFMSLRVP